MLRKNKPPFRAVAHLSWTVGKAKVKEGLGKLLKKRPSKHDLKAIGKFLEKIKVSQILENVDKNCKFMIFQKNFFFFLRYEILF